MLHIIYFIQDFKSFFLVHGSDFVYAQEGYLSPHYSIYSIIFLQVWFRERKFGPYAFLDAPTTYLFTFEAQPAIRRWPKLIESNLLSSTKTRILIAYARTHADRNAYVLLVDSLLHAFCKGIFPGNWKFVGVRAVDDYIIYLGGLKIPFDIRKNIPEPEYESLVRIGDIGVSLMTSPHPSLAASDFAAAGLITVTNSFETKTKKSYLSISKKSYLILYYF